MPGAGLGPGQTSVLGLKPVLAFPGRHCSTEIKQNGPMEKKEPWAPEATARGVRQRRLSMPEFPAGALFPLRLKCFLGKSASPWEGDSGSSPFLSSMFSFRWFLFHCVINMRLTLVSILKFILSQQALLRAYCVPGTGLGAQDPAAPGADRRLTAHIHSFIRSLEESVLRPTASWVLC